MGGKRDKAKLLYREEVYTPEGAKTLTDKQLRKEYSRLRSIARKRLERFTGTEWTDTQVYKLNAGVYKPLNEIKSDRELRHMFAGVARFVSSATGSVKGLENQRKEAVQTLNDRGYNFVTKENFRKFAEFMEYARVANLNRMYDSKRIADFYKATEKQKLSSEQLQKSFRSWSKKQKKLRKIQNRNPRTSDEYRTQVDTENSKYFEDGNRLIEKYQKQKTKNSEVDWKKARTENAKRTANQTGFAGWNNPKEEDD
jgi:hypothetical protein